MSNSRKEIPATNYSGSLSIFPTFSHKKYGDGFTTRDYEFLSENENFRYLDNSKSGKIGHAVIIKNKEGEKIALQYAIPVENNNKTPKVLPLTNIQEIIRFGMTRYRAELNDHTPMYAKRYHHAKIGNGTKEDEVDIAYFSPSEKEGKEPFWGDADKNIPLFHNEFTAEEKQELEEEINELKPIIKGGKEVVIDPESVRVRDANRTRNPSQNQVMNESARDAYEAFLDTMTDELSKEMKTILQRAIDAPLRDVFYSNYRPEWLHAEGFSLTHVSENPQRKDNLGAAPKWSNTEMMVLERIAKWFALNIPNSYVSIKPYFEMLLDSELIKNIKFEVTIKEKERFIQFLQDLNPFKKYPLFRKPSDLAQATAITHNILQGVSPISEQKIISAALISEQSLSHALPSLSLLPSTHPILSEKNAVLSRPEQMVGIINQSPSPIGQITQKKTKQLFPTHLEHERSIVQVLTTSHDPDYDEPWLGTHVTGCSGTGFVVSNNGKKYILTNAHCVENSVVVRVRLANDRKKKYETTRKCVSYQCDLALLEVTDPEFHKLAQPVELGKMVGLQDKVQTVGFPMGGNEISISKGIVSRIEVRDYCMSGLDMLQVQVDAAINHGNSGGPVFSNDKVVGVAFQGYDKQGLGFMIPIPVIKHFLQEALSEKVYRGFPILPVMLQTLENPSLRKYHGMTEQQTGVRVSKIDYLCDAFNKLKEDDILLEIDSLPISNEGTVDIPGVGNCIDLIHVTHMKFIDDTVQLKVLRKNAESKKPEIHNISVVLDRVPLETEKVPQTEHDKMPTYYIASGISFTPLSRNYMEGKGAELEEYFMVEEGCQLADTAKKHPDEQIVVVNDILSCEETQGYEAYENCIIKEVNNRSIKNIWDVITAIENNTEPMHYITTSLKNVIVVKNMSKAEHNALLKQYKIHSDRSEDLLLPQETTKQLNAPGNTFLNNITPTVSILPSKEKPISNNFPLDSEVNEEMKIEKNEHNLTKEDLGIIGMMPGQKKFFNMINELEERYKDLPEDEDDDFILESSEEKEDDQSISSHMEIENKSKLSHSEQMEREEKDEHSESEQNKRESHFMLEKVQNRHRLFQKRKHPDYDSDDVEALAPVRKRYKIE